MKKTLLLSMAILMAFSFSTCTRNNDKKNEVKEVKTPAVTESFDWILGSWQRIDDEEGKETFESWQKKNDSYTGHGYTLQNKDTVWQEKMLLIKSAEDWNLEIRGEGDVNPIIFRVTNLEKDKFTCENPTLDFPKKIQYWKEGESMKASVAGDDMEISFEFKKIK